MIGIFVNLWSRISGAGAYLLDQFGGAAAAYSLRRLSSSYGGPAIRVRRSLDNAEQDIGFQGKDLDQAALNSFVGYQNLLTYSEQFDNAAWTKGNFSTISANATTAPDGTLTADKHVSPNSTSAFAIVSSNQSVSSGVVYTFSVYAKRSEVRFIQLRNNISGVLFCNFDLELGVAGTPSVGLAANINNEGNGWYRCIITATSGATASTVIFGVNMANSLVDGLAPIYNGNGVNGYFIWGAQLNTGSTAQPYQPTVATANTANGFVTEWYTQDSAVHDNLLLQSQTFEDAYWTKENSTISANTLETTAPNGTSTADILNEGVATGIHRADSQSISFSARHSASVYLKYKSARYVRLVIGGISNDPVVDNRRVDFDLVNGVVLRDTLYSATGQITPVGGGWFRVSFVMQAPSITVSNRFSITMLDAAGSDTISYTGTNREVYIWGAQVSPTSWLQPYQQTVASAITRRDAIQTTAANQPQIVNGGNIVLENGKPAMLFDGVNDTFSVPSGLDVLQNVGFANVFSVVANSITTGTKSPLFISTPSLATRIQIQFIDGIYSTIGRRLDGDSIGTVSGTVNRYAQALFYSAVQYATSDAFQYVNGLIDGSNTSFQTDGNTSNTASSIVAIGSTGTVNFFNGDMQEITLYNTNQLPNRVNIESSINSYYKIY